MHIRHHKHGYRVIVQHRGVKRSEVTKTRPEATLAGARFYIELGAEPSGPDMSIDELLAHWQLGATLSDKYREDIESIIRRLPEPFLDRRITTITPASIEQFYGELARTGWSAHRIRRVHTVLSSAWTMAQRYEWVRDNPMNVARKPRVNDTDVRPPTKAELDTIYKAARSDLLLYFRLSANIGARAGEIVALQWTDFTDTQLVIQRSLTYTKKAGLKVSAGKTGRKGQRVVAITKNLARQLRALHAEQSKIALARRLPPPMWIFSLDAGQSPWRPGYVSLYFRRLCARVNVTGVRLHDFRHYMATQALAAGVPLHIVSKRLGHTKIATTGDVYSHYIPAADQDAADALERLESS